MAHPHTPNPLITLDEQKPFLASTNDSTPPTWDDGEHTTTDWFRPRLT